MPTTMRDDVYESVTNHVYGATGDHIHDFEDMQGTMSLESMDVATSELPDLAVSIQLDLGQEYGITVELPPGFLYPKMTLDEIVAGIVKLIDKRDRVFEYVTNPLYGYCGLEFMDHEDIPGDRALESLRVEEGDLVTLASKMQEGVQVGEEIAWQMPHDLLRLDLTVDQIVRAVTALIPTP